MLYFEFEFKMFINFLNLLLTHNIFMQIIFLMSFCLSKKTGIKTKNGGQSDFKNNKAIKKLHKNL